MKQSVKAAVKRGDVSNAKMLAKELVRSRKATNRMHTSKARMNSVMMQMENQLGAPGALRHACWCGLSVLPTPALDAAQVKMTGHMQKSTQVMQHMNRLIKVGDIQETMQSMQKEMMKVRPAQENG